MSWKIILIVFMLFALYIYSYYRSPKNTYIIQSHIRMFKPEILLDKQPIIIDDNDYDILTLKSTFMSINPSHNFILTGQDTWCKNKYKYLMIQSKIGPCDILLCNPNSVNTSTNTPVESDATEIVEAQLSENQILIVPFNWIYLVNSQVDCIGVHDFITYFLP